MLKTAKLIILLSCMGLSLSQVMAQGNAGGEMSQADDKVATTYPKIDYSQVEDPDLVMRGEYLSKAGDCIACHTNSDEDGKYAGGLPVVTPFGTFYSPNITPDVETGIGSWSRLDFINALKRGVNPGGQHYFPVFPYLYYNKLPTEDIDALYAYFKAIPAVNKPNIPHDIMFPFNIRLAQLGWKLMFFYPYRGEWQPKDHQSDEINRGEYLVETLGHCAMCHSPINPLGGEIRSKHLTGGVVDGYYAPPINETSLSKASVEKVMRVFTHNERTGGTKVKGPMLEVNYDSLQHLPESDLRAIAMYLKSVPAPKVEAVVADDKVGKAKSIYRNHCSNCHTTGASGAPIITDESAWKPYLDKGMDDVYTNAINGIGAMPAMGACTECDDQDIRDTIDYMVAIITGEGVTAESSRPKGEKIPALTALDGQRIYNENCSTCHTPGGGGGGIKLDQKQLWREMLEVKGVANVFTYILYGARGQNTHAYGQSLNDAELMAAVKHMLGTALPERNFNLW